MIFFYKSVFPVFSGIFLEIGGILLAHSNLDSYFMILSTSLIDGPLKSIKRRIPNVPEVISVDKVPETKPRDKIEMVTKSYECLLPTQKWTNPKCRQLTHEEIIKATNDFPLKYKDIVNMQQLTGLEETKFSDIYDLSPNSSVSNIVPDISKIGRPKPRLRGTVSDISKTVRPKGKLVNFLEKFADPLDIPESYA